MSEIQGNNDEPDGLMAVQPTPQVNATSITAPPSQTRKVSIDLIGHDINVRRIVIEVPAHWGDDELARLSGRALDCQTRTSGDWVNEGGGIIVQDAIRVVADEPNDLTTDAYIGDAITLCGDLQSQTKASDGESPESVHIHDWVVFSTAVQDGSLILQCVDCGLHGVVKKPTKKEWSKAFRAPSRPYRWTDETRVAFQPRVSKDKRYVVRKYPSPKCECYVRRGVTEPVGFERFPNELTRPPIPQSESDRKELEALAWVVIEGKLCSFQFEFYLECFERDTGVVHCPAVKEIANRISRLDRKGMHSSPSVVSRLLQEISRQPLSYSN